MAIDQRGQWRSHYFRESLQLSQRGDRNFREIGSREKRAVFDADTVADRSIENYVALERRDGFRHSVDNGAIHGTGQLAQLLCRRQLGRIFPAVHPQLEFDQRIEWCAHHLGQRIQHQQRSGRERICYSER